MKQPTKQQLQSLKNIKVRSDIKPFKIVNIFEVEHGQYGEFRTISKSWIKQVRDVEDAIKWIEANKEEKDWKNWEIEIVFEDDEEEGVMVYYPEYKEWLADFT